MLEAIVTRFGDGGIALESSPANDWATWVAGETVAGRTLEVPPLPLAARLAQASSRYRAATAGHVAVPVPRIIAADWQALGCNVVPLHAGRKPMRGCTIRGYQHANDPRNAGDVAVTRGLSRAHGVGVLIDSGPTRWAVLDVDGDPTDLAHAERLALWAVDNLAGGVDPGLVVATRRGFHLWYRVDDDAAWSKALHDGRKFGPAEAPKAIELKIAGNFVPAPGSLCGDRMYIPESSGPSTIDALLWPVLRPDGFAAARRTAPRERMARARRAAGVQPRAPKRHTPRMVPTWLRSPKFGDLEPHELHELCPVDGRGVELHCPFGCEDKNPSAYAYRATKTRRPHLLLGCSACSRSALMPARPVPEADASDWGMPVELRRGDSVTAALGHVDEEVSEGGALIVSAPMGSGKTHWIWREEPVFNRVLIVAPGREQVRTLGQRFGAATHLDGHWLEDSRAYITTPESLKKAHDVIDAEGLDVLVIDEADQVLRALFARYNVHQRIYGHLVEALRVAQRVVLMSGTLTAADVEQWREILRDAGKDVRAVQVDTRVDREIVIASPGQLRHRVDGALRRRESVALATTMGPRSAEKLAAQWRAAYPGLRVLVLRGDVDPKDKDRCVADRAEREAMLDRIMRAEVLSDVADVVIYTPIVRAAVSIEAKVDHVMHMHRAVDMPAADVLQQVMRFRRVREREIYMAVTGRVSDDEVERPIPHDAVGTLVPVRTALAQHDAAKRTASDPVAAIVQAAADARFDAVTYATNDELDSRAMGRRIEPLPFEDEIVAAKRLGLRVGLEDVRVVHARAGTPTRGALFVAVYASDGTPQRLGQLDVHDGEDVSRSLVERFGQPRALTLHLAMAS